MENKIKNTKSDSDISVCVEKINGIMRRKLSLLYEIHRYSVQEEHFVTESGVGDLSNILDEKQMLITETDSLDRAFLKAFGSLKKLLGISSLEELNELSRDNESDAARAGLANLRLCTEEIMEVLQKIDAVDKRSNIKILRLRDSITNDLKRIRMSRHVSSAYGNDMAARMHSGSVRPAAARSNSGGAKPAAAAAHSNSVGAKPSVSRSRPIKPTPAIGASRFDTKN